MITAYRAQGARLVPLDLNSHSLREALWIDLEHPTAAEEDAVEAALGIGIPTREDMQEIEASSRVYVEGGVLFLTAQVLATRPAGIEAGLDIGPVTFVLMQDRLVTVHYHHPGSFKFFADWAARHDTALNCGVNALLGLMESVVDRLADVLEGEARKLDALSRNIFDGNRPASQSDRLSLVLQRIGRAEDLNGKVKESLATVLRMLNALAVPGLQGVHPLLAGLEKAQLKSLLQDLKSLREVAAAQAEKIRFQLDATLGVINIRQSDIVKLFSVVAFVFLPPTLIASIYGMNFDVMPELRWSWGYPMALVAMLVSAVLPWLFFRWKKWL
ncbi:magnesium transporter CorA family protein [Neotabrizicola sp. sgz301269]|uniref:magnesium transporter CorA family protein n=1 Tax=Neotabrizicola sp. sgz301269 TaxID=3276282 RepID=UPI00376F5B0F